MASGKTSLGELLAERLNLSFTDLDRRIEHASGMSVADFFRTYGEESFRKSERAELLRVVAMPGHIVATGGGTPCFEDNMEIMDRSGITVFLDTSVERILSRLGTEVDGRPLLDGIESFDRERFITSHLYSRLPFYRRSRIIVDGNKAPGEIAALLTPLLKELFRHGGL